MPPEINRDYLDSYFTEKNELHGLSVRDWFEERLAEIPEEEIEQSYLYTPLIIADRVIKIGIASGEIPEYNIADASQGITRGIVAGVLIGGIDNFYAKDDVTEEEFEESAETLVKVIDELELTLLGSKMRDSTLYYIEKLTKRLLPPGWDEYMSDKKYELIDDSSQYTYFQLGSSVAGYMFGSIPDQRALKKFIAFEKQFQDL